MSEIYILNKNGVSVKTFTEETGLISTKFEEGLNKGSSFLFELDATVHGAEHVKEENKVIFKDKEGDLRLFVIKEIDDINTIDGAVTEATCEPESMELKDKIVVDRRFNNQTAQTALNAALEGTRWTGVVEAELGNASTNFYYITAIDAIWKILEVWGGEFKDVVEFDGNKITARKIIIKQRLGADNGLRFEIDHNIDEIQRTVISYPVTAMYGRGASLEIEDDEGNATGGHTRYIDFGDVEWSKAKGDPVDKPKGPKWVGDPDALLEYGYEHNGQLLHREAEFSNQDYDDPKELLQATWEALQQAKKPEVNYRLTVDVSDQNIALGDTARVIDREFSRPIEIQTRIISIEYDILDIDGSVTVEMGQFLSAYEDDRLDQVIDTIDRNQGKWGADSKPITNDRFPDIKPGTPSNVEATGAFQTIQLFWDYGSEVYISHYEVYGSQVKDFVPDTQHLLWRGRVSSFVHEVDTDQTWYYRVRAVNTRGTASDYSPQVSASTVRIITDDILFGSIVADHLENNLDIADKLAQNTIDRINQGPMQEITYTQQEIEATEERLNKDLNSRIGNVNQAIDNLNNVADNLRDRADSTDSLLSEHNGRINTIVTDFDELEGRFSTTLTDIQKIDNTVQSHSAKLLAQADLIAAKVDDLTYQRDKSGILSSIEANATELSLLAEGLELRVTKEEFEVVNGLTTHVIAKGPKEPSKDLHKFSWGLWVECLENIHIGQATVYSGGDQTVTIGIKPANDWNKVLDSKKFTLKKGENRINLNFTLKKGEYSIYVTGHENIGLGRHNGAGLDLPYTSGSFIIKGGKSSSNQETTNAYYYFYNIEIAGIGVDGLPVSTELDAEITSVRDRVTKTEATLKVHAEDIALKAERDEVYTRTVMDGLLGSKVDETVYKKKVGQLDVAIDGITGRVLNTETEINGLTGEMTSAKSEIASLDVKANGIQASVSNLDKTVTSQGTKLTKAEGEIKTLAGEVALGANEIKLIDGRLSTAESTLKVMPDQIDLKVTQGLDSLQIDGTNLITDTEKEWQSTSITSNSAYGIYKNNLNPIFSELVNKDVSFLFEVYLVNTVNAKADFRIYGTNGSPKYRFDNIIFSNIETNKWVTVTGTSRMRGTSDAGQGRIEFYGQNNPNTTKIKIRKFKMVSGNKAPLSWSPAPEDQVDKTNVLSSINLSKEGVRIAGNKIHLTGQTLMDDAIIGTAAIANLSVTNAKLGLLSVGTAQMQDLSVVNSKIANLAVDDAKIANLSVNKLKAGTLDASKVKIRGGSSTDYTLIDGSLLESRGRFTRTWFGKTTTHDVKLKLENGYLRARNDSLNRSLYFSEFGISTFMDGTGDYIEPGGGSSGSLIWWDQTYSPSKANGITLNSYAGVVALKSDNNRVVIDSAHSVNIESRESPVYIRPYTKNRPGYNTFDFTLANEGNASEVDGFLMYGSDVNGYASGFRFSKAASDPTISIVDTNFTRGGKTTFDVGNVRTNDIRKRDGSGTVYWNGSGTGTTGGSGATMFNTLIASAVKVRDGESDFHIACQNGGSVRVTDGYGYNSGKGITYNDLYARQLFANTLQWNAGAAGINLYIKPSASGEVKITAPNTTDIFRPLRTSKVYETSSEKFKQDIRIFEGNALEMINKSVIYDYEKEGSYGREIGFIIERETPSILVNQDAIDGYSHRSLNTKAIQELDTKFYGLESRLDEKDLEIQYLKQKLKQLEEKIV